MADVRAGDVQLDRRQARLRAQHLGHRDELVFVLAGDVGDHRRAHRAEIRQMMLDEMRDAVVVQADRVEQARGGLDRAQGSDSPRGAGTSPSWGSPRPAAPAARTAPSRGHSRRSPTPPAPGSSAPAVPVPPAGQPIRISFRFRCTRDATRHISCRMRPRLSTLKHHETTQGFPSA